MATHTSLIRPPNGLAIAEYLTSAFAKVAAIGPNRRVA